MGTLAHRLDEHEELHQLAKRLGIPIDHNHEPCEDGEDDVALALRLLEDGETQHGQSDTAARS